MSNIFRKAYPVLNMYDTGCAENKHNFYSKLRVAGAWIFTILLVLLANFVNIPYIDVIQLILVILVLLLFSIPFYASAWKQFYIGYYNMDTLAAISISITFLFSVFNTFLPGFWYARGLQPHVYYETIAIIVAIILTGKMLERRILHDAPSISTRITGGFISAIFALSVLTFIAWIFFGGKEAMSHGVYSAISVWVMACPCALALVTPVALMVGKNRASENHILIKEAWALEQMPDVDVVVLDKTGTLTEGHPSIIGWLWVQAQEKHFKNVLLAAGMKTDHILINSIVAALEKEENVAPAVLESYEKLSEKGVEVVYKGVVYWVGNHKLLKDYQVYLSDILGDMLAQYESDGNSIVYFGRENELVSFIAIKDQIKPTSAEAIKELRGQDIEVCMLTSDGERTASSVAGRLGIIRYISDALPEDKENFIHELQLQGRTVAMVGDGVNDTQALETADVSIAMGEGKDIAMDISMVTLKTSDLLLLPKAFSLSRQVTGLIHQNLFWALIFNLIGIPIAAGVLYPVYGILLTPALATVAMALAGISVVLSSLKLKY